MAIFSLVEIVKRYEGYSAKVYICPAGYPTIGWGHLCEPDHPDITPAEGEAYLVEDLEIARAAVKRLISWPLNQNQLDALISWTFNLGSARLRGSTLRAKINRGELADAPAEFRKWVYGGGQRLPGLVLRREAEAALFALAVS